MTAGREAAREGGGMNAEHAVVARQVTFDAKREPMFEDERGTGWVPLARFNEEADALAAALARQQELEGAVNNAMYVLNPNQGERPDSVLADLWLRTTLPPEHPNHVDRDVLSVGADADPGTQPLVYDLCAHGCGREATVQHADERFLCRPCYDAEAGAYNPPGCPTCEEIA